MTTVRMKVGIHISKTSILTYEALTYTDWSVISEVNQSLLRHRNLGPQFVALHEDLQERE